MSHHTTPGGHITPSRLVAGYAGGGHWTPQEKRAAWRRTHPKWSSTIKQAGLISFPSFTGERVYMQPFIKVDGEVLLPSKLTRWAPTISAMLEGIKTTARMYLMIDQSTVEARTSHRRPSPHIDGLWREKGAGTITADLQTKKKFEEEIILLASDIEGCVAYTGEYDPVGFKPGGDCSGMDLSKLERVVMKAEYVYHCTAATIHESIPVTKACERALVRINIPSS